MKLIVVHGTNAGADADSGEKWWQRNSEFHRQLSGHIGTEVEVEPFHWSGANSERERRIAGARLLSKIRSQTMPFHVVGHSHGGSVIIEALRAAQLKTDRLELLRSWVCIGTPFITFRRKGFLLNRIGFFLRVIVIAQLLLLVSIALHFTIRFSVSCAWSQFTQCAAPGRYLPGHYFIALADAEKMFGKPIAQMRSELVDKKYKPDIQKVLTGELPMRPIWVDIEGRKWFVQHFVDAMPTREGVLIVGMVDLNDWLGQVASPYLVSFVVCLLLLVLTAKGSQESDKRLHSLKFAKNLEQAFGDRFICLTDKRDEAFNGLRLGHGWKLDVVSAHAVLPLMNAVGVALSVVCSISLLMLTLYSSTTEYIDQQVFSLLKEGVLTFLPFAVVASLVVSIVVYGLIYCVAWLALGPLFAAGSNRYISGALRGHAYGADVVGERTAGVQMVPREFSCSANPLPEELSQRLRDFTRPHAFAFVEELRESLAEDRQKSLLSDVFGGMSGRELIHNSYFFVPEIVKLIAFSLCIFEGMERDRLLERDPEFANASEWFDQIRPTQSTEPTRLV